MEIKQVLQKVQKDFEDLKTKGVDAVGVDQLISYAKELQETAGESLDYAKMRHQSSLAEYDAKNKASLEVGKWVIETGKDAVQALMLVSGGGVVALMTFLGVLVTKTADPRIGIGLVGAMMYFGGAVLIAAFTFGVRYLSQACYSIEYNKTGTGFAVVAIVLALVGYSAFGLGLYGAAAAIRLAFWQP